MELFYVHRFIVYRFLLLFLLKVQSLQYYSTPFFIKRFSSLKQLKKKDWLAFFGVALLGGAIGTMAITKALFYVNFVNLSVVILLQKLQPVFAISLATIFLKEKLPKEFFLVGSIGNCWCILYDIRYITSKFFYGR